MDILIYSRCYSRSKCDNTYRKLNIVGETSEENKTGKDATACVENEGIEFNNCESESQVFDR